MGWACALKVPATRVAIPAVVLCGAIACTTLAACEYTYDDGRLPVRSTPTATVPQTARSRDPAFGQTVTGDALNAWALGVLPDAVGLAYFSNYGLLAPGETETGTTVPLPGGSYALTFACKGGSSVTFIVRKGDAIVLETDVQCGARRIDTLQLEANSILGITALSDDSANFACRVSRV